MSVHPPAQPPASVADLDPFLRTRNKTRWKAHVPDGDTPLCVDCDTAFGVEWVEDIPEYYPAPDEWFSLCSRCLERLERR